MELLALRYFCTAAKLGSITGAARKMYVSQPAMSRCIKRLEDELKVPLFERSGRTITLTTAGKAVLKRAEICLSLIDTMPEMLESLTGTLCGTFRLTPVTIPPRFSELMEGFHQAYPGISIELIRNERAHQKPDCAEVTITLAPLLFDSLNSERLTWEELLLVLPKGHPLGKEKKIPLFEVRKENFIFPVGHAAMRNVYESLCQFAGFIPRISAEINNPTAQKSLIESGAGISIMPRSTFESLSPENLELLQISSPSPWKEIQITWPNNRVLSPCTSAFIAFAHSFYDSYGKSV